MLVLSAPILDEIQRTLSTPQVRRYMRLSGREVDAWLASVQGIGELVAGPVAVHVVARDLDDDKYFAAAIEGDADIVVSGDRHVRDVGQFEGIPVLTPRAFLKKLRI